METKIKTIDGKLLEAILSRARVFGHKCSETRSIVIVEPLKAVFLPKTKDTLIKYKYLMFFSDHQGVFYLDSGHNCSPAAMYRLMIKEWDSSRRKPILDKNHGFK